MARRPSIFVLFAPICLSQSVAQPVARQLVIYRRFRFARFGTLRTDARACPPPRAAPRTDALGLSEPDVAPGWASEARRQPRRASRVARGGKKRVGTYNDGWRSRRIDPFVRVSALSDARREGSRSVSNDAARDARRRGAGSEPCRGGATRDHPLAPARPALDRRGVGTKRPSASARSGRRGVVVRASADLAAPPAVLPTVVQRLADVAEGYEGVLDAPDVSVTTAAAFSALSPRLDSTQEGFSLFRGVVRGAQNAMGLVGDGVDPSKLPTGGVVESLLEPGKVLGDVVTQTRGEASLGSAIDDAEWTKVVNSVDVDIGLLLLSVVT